MPAWMRAQAASTAAALAAGTAPAGPRDNPDELAARIAAASSCQNCGASDATPRSFDMDLPPVVLCGLCAVAIAVDPETFAAMTRRPDREGT